MTDEQIKENIAFRMRNDRNTVLKLSKKVSRILSNFRVDAEGSMQNVFDVEQTPGSGDRSRSP